MVVVSGELLGVSAITTEQDCCAIIKYDSIFWTTDTKVKMRQRQHLVGLSTKQYIHPSHHEESVAYLLAVPVSEARQTDESSGGAGRRSDFQTTASCEANAARPVPLCGSMTLASVMRKRKYREHVSEDEIHGEGEEVELDPAFFTKKSLGGQFAPPRQYRAIRHRKKVKFAGARKEQDFYQYMPTYSVVGTELSKEAKDDIASHTFFSRPYVPADEEIPEFYYSDDSDELMDTLTQVLSESSDPCINTDTIEVDEGYSYEDESDSDMEYSLQHNPDTQEREEFSESHFEYIEGIEPPTDTYGEDLELDVEKKGGNLRIEDIPDMSALKKMVQCPACEETVVHSRMNEHLDSGCEGSFTAEESNTRPEFSIEGAINSHTFNTTVQCPICQKFVIHNKINGHLDAGCNGFLADELLPTSNLEERAPASASAVEDYVQASMHLRRRLSIDVGQPKSRRVKFADVENENKPFRRSPTPAPPWFRTKISPPLVGQLTRATDVEGEADRNESAADFKNYVVPIGHFANFEEQDVSQGKGKQAVRPVTLNDKASEEPLKARGGNVVPAKPKIGSGSGSEDPSQVDDEADRGRSRLRGGHINRKRSQARSRGHGRRRRERSLTDTY